MAGTEAASPRYGPAPEAEANHDTSLHFLEVQGQRRSQALRRSAAGMTSNCAYDCSGLVHRWQISAARALCIALPPEVHRSQHSN